MLIFITLRITFADGDVQIILGTAALCFFFPARVTSCQIFEHKLCPTSSDSEGRWYLNTPLGTCTYIAQRVTTTTYEAAVKWNFAKATACFPSCESLCEDLSGT